MSRNPNGPSVEEKDDWHDALRDQAKAEDLAAIAERVAEREAEQRRLDIANLRLYAGLFRQYGWGTDVVHWSVFEQTLEAVAQRLERQQQQEAK